VAWCDETTVIRAPSTTAITATVKKSDIGKSFRRSVRQAFSPLSCRRPVTSRRIVCVAASIVVALSAAAGATRSHAAASSTAAAPSTALVTGRKLYRQFCGKCHALDEALSAGFGSNGKFGLGEYGGPSFNELRVPYSFSVSAVTLPTGGHEKVRTKISSKQLHQVAAFIADVTRKNPVPAKPTDG
jgi:mono/diheme cytochrome c family protein